MAKEMTALTIRQPWAWFIVNGHKDIENRSWKPTAKWIGKRIIVHSSQRRLTKADYQNFLEICKDMGIKRFPKSVDDFDYGAMVGSAILSDVVRGAKSEWAVPGNWHFKLTGAKKMKPKKKKGQLGFFTVKV